MDPQHKKIKIGLAISPFQLAWCQREAKRQCEPFRVPSVSAVIQRLIAAAMAVQQ